MAANAPAFAGIDDGDFYGVGVRPRVYSSRPRGRGGLVHMKGHNTAGKDMKALPPAKNRGIGFVIDED
jgi:hypothetical protein